MKEPSGVSGSPRQQSARADTIGYEPVDTKVLCVLTRFALRSPLMLPFFCVLFRRVRRGSRERLPGLLKSSFLVGSPGDPQI